MSQIAASFFPCGEVEITQDNRDDDRNVED